MSPNCAPTTIATIGIDLGKNTFHLVGLDTRGAIVLQLKLSRGQSPTADERPVLARKRTSRFYRCSFMSSRPNLSALFASFWRGSSDERPLSSLGTGRRSHLLSLPGTLGGCRVKADIHS
jgi:hypothetical protein